MRPATRLGFVIALAAAHLVVASGTDRAAAQEPESSITLPVPDQPWVGDLDGMIERRMIRVLVTYSKTHFFLDGPDKRGVTYEVFTEFEKKLNKKLRSSGALKGKHLKVHVVFILVNRDELIPRLIEGRGDIAASNLTITPERLEFVDFAAPVYSGVKEIVVAGPGGPELTSLEDLAGQEIWVRESSSYHESLLELNRSFTASGKPPMRLRPADEYLEDEDLLEMVDAGLLPLLIVDDHKAELWAKIFDRLVLHRDLVVRDGGDIAWAMRKGSPKLAAELNGYVAGVKKGTLLGNIMFNRYLKDTRWARNALAQEELDRFKGLQATFQRFGARYDVDWLLALAQGYQESRLDQDTRSPRGAIGIMQLLPTTAADPSVGIPDITNVESNVHAGIKYLDFLRDRYFSDQAIQPPHDLFFALAAYNAGPARVARMRSKASTLGLDPNRWFNNVEIAAAQMTGRETVQYVSNIYKYYVIYRLVLERDHLVEEAVRSGRPSSN